MNKYLKIHEAAREFLRRYRFRKVTAMSFFRQEMPGSILVNILRMSQNMQILMMRILRICIPSALTRTEALWAGI